MNSHLRFSNGAARIPSKYRASRNVAAKADDCRATSARHRALRGTSRRGGFSLLEVAVALVIFVVGALAIVRIFPGALSVVQNSENRGVATRLGQTTLTTYGNNPLSEPYSTYDFDPSFAGNWSDFPGSVAGSRNANLSLPGRPPSKDDILPANFVQSSVGQSALGRFRYITGETHIVPGSSAQQPITIFTRFPYSGQRLVYREVDVAGVTINSAGDLDFSQATVNSPSALVPQDTLGGARTGRQIFYDVATAISDPRRPPSAYRGANAGSFDITDRQIPIFYISYRWKDSVGRVNAVTDEPKRFPDNSTWGPATSKVLQGSIATPNVVAEPVKVRVRIPFPFTFSNSRLTPEDQANRGLGLYGWGSFLASGEKISFDYLVRDWRWLTVDSSASTATDTPKDEDGNDILPPYGNPVIPQQLQLPVRFVSTENPNTADYPLYSCVGGADESGSYRQPTFGQWSPETFTQPGNTDNSTVSPGVTPKYGNLWKVDPKSGRVVFNVGLGTPLDQRKPSVTDIRVVYRAADGWGHQVSVASKNYVPFVPRTVGDTTFNPREPWREYFLDLASNGLYFHPADAGHSVMVSFEYQEISSGTYRTVTNQIVTLPDDLDLNSLPAAAISDIGNPRFTGQSRTPDGSQFNNKGVKATLLDLSGTPIVNGGATTLTAITAVKGVSIRARSAWLDNDRYSQTSVVGYRKNAN